MLDELKASVELVEEYAYNSALVVEKYRLRNGLVLLYLPDHTAPLFSYQTWFRVGSGDEVEGKTGIAHFFEHLMFKGTSNHPEGEYDRALEGLGARVNAATWLDWTYYYVDLPAGNLREVAALEADRMHNLVLEPEPVEAERKVVMNERRERVDNDPGGKLSEALWQMAFQSHPYGRPTIGWMPDIEGLSLEDCRALYRTWYAPNNAVLVLPGDVQRASLLRTVVELYGDLEAQELPPRPSVVEPKQEALLRQTEHLQISTERLMMAYHAPAVTDPLFPALEVLNEALFEGDSGRLQRALVTEGELASGFYAFVPSFRDPGLFEISVDLRPGRTAEEAEEVVLLELNRAVVTGLLPEEIEKAKNRLETMFYRRLQTANQRAQGLGYWEVTAGDYKQLFTIAERYRNVTAEQVSQVAAQVFFAEGRSVIYARPNVESKIRRK